MQVLLSYEFYQAMNDVLVNMLNPDTLNQDIYKQG